MKNGIKRCSAHTSYMFHFCKVGEGGGIRGGKRIRISIEAHTLLGKEIDCAREQGINRRIEGHIEKGPKEVEREERTEKGT